MFDGAQPLTAQQNKLFTDKCRPYENEGRSESGSDFEPGAYSPFLQASYPSQYTLKAQAY